jgi:hypothetical protein
VRLRHFLILSRYVLLFLQGLCKDAAASSSRFSYGISTFDEGVMATGNDVEGLRGPVLLEMLKDLSSLAFPLQSLLRLALEHATPCAAGHHLFQFQHHHYSFHSCSQLFSIFLSSVFAAGHDSTQIIACASVYLKACR